MLVCLRQKLKFLFQIKSRLVCFAMQNKPSGCGVISGCGIFLQLILVNAARKWAIQFV
jgi:hypothetical protein